MPEIRSFVAGGHVFCHATRSDRDVSECRDCEHLRRIDERGSPPSIVCEIDVSAEDARDDPLLKQWWLVHHRHAR